MSLVIHTIVKDGIVVSADTRTTCKDDKGNTRYNDTAEKIVPFPNKIVVTHTGDSMITDKLSVTEFLLNLRKKCGKKTTITDLPIKLLNEYLIACGNQSHKIYFISMVRIRLLHSQGNRLVMAQVSVEQLTLLSL